MNRYCFLDLETTGFEPSKDSIIEVSLVVTENGTEVGRLDRVTIPDKSLMSDFVSQLTGISQAEIDEKGVYFTELKDEVQALIGEAVIVGHNIDFDINFLQGNGVDLTKNQRLDTHELARILLPGESSYALEVLTKNYGFTHEDAHRAMSDVLASKDLFELLLERIEALPREFLDQLDTFLRDQTTWYARHLFLAAAGSDAPQSRTVENTPSLADTNRSNLVAAAVNTLAQQQNAFARMSDTRQATQDLSAIATDLAAQGQPVCLVTPRLGYFEHFPSLPTPEVLFDIRRCPAFLAARNNQLGDADTTFYLKCQYRHYLGYRGLWHFDLFFKERGLWQELCCQGNDCRVFNAVVAEKTNEPVLTCSPAAFAQLAQHPSLAGRACVLDEGELCAEAWLQAPTKQFSFQSQLHGPDEVLAQATQFFIHRFVRDFIEPVLGKTVGTFPERVLLNFNDQLDRFADELKALLPEDQHDFWLPWLQPTDEKLVRWVVYAPESGNLSLFAWHPNDWRALKDNLHHRTKLITTRHNADYNDRLFFRVFVGEIEGESFDFRPESSPKLVIPKDLVSHNSPDFNAYCADQIKQVFAAASHNVAANFSSLETLRSTYDTLQPSMGDDQFLAAEKVMGGDGKLLEKLSQHQAAKILLLFQKIMRPELEQYAWSDLVIQKFPFGAPDPLLQHLENKMKETGHNWWSAWVMPRLSATLSRKIGQFPGLKTVHFLDPRENSRWGKAVLKDLFK